MDISELIKNRRATPPRFFNSREIPEELLWQCLENANWAPNHKGTEPWRFHIYRGAAREKMIRQVEELLFSVATPGESVNKLKVEKFISNLENSDTVILVIMERDVARRVPEWQEIAAVACAVQNMWLSATASGMSAFWSTPEFMERIEDYFGIKSNQKFMGFFLLGYSDIEYPSPGRGPVSGKTIWIK